MKRSRRMLRATRSPFVDAAQHLFQVHPVSSRPEEVLSIALHLLGQFATVHGKEVPALSQDAADFLTCRSWSLNDLAARLSRAVAANQGSLITAADLA